MSRLPDIPNLKLDRTKVEYEVEHEGNTVGWITWDYRWPNTWTAEHYGSFPGRKTFKGTRARKQAILWLLEQEAGES